MTGLGPVGHVAFVVDDFSAAMAALEVLGVRWSSVTEPTARLRAPQDGSESGGEVSEASVKYVTSRGGEPRVKLISAVPGTLFTARFTGAPHHCSYWVEDLDESTASLKNQGWREEATGLGEDEVARYRYLVNDDGHRVELGLFQHRAEFDALADA